MNLRHVPRLSEPVRLIAIDMDGTLLDGEGNIPPDFAPLCAKAHAQGILIVPASGRQLATLQDMFPTAETGIDTYIAENGTVISHAQELISVTPLDHSVVKQALEAAATIEQPHMVVLNTPHTSFVTADAHARFGEELTKYCHAVTVVDDLYHAVLSHQAQVVKIAIHCPAGSEEFLYPVLRGVIDESLMAVSAFSWLDIMAPGANKGTALTTLAGALGLDMKHTCAFGDYLNDLELLTEAGVAIAMENAHPLLLERADFVAPPNTEYGVVQVLSSIVEQQARR